MRRPPRNARYRENIVRPGFVAHVMDGLPCGLGKGITIAPNETARTSIPAGVDQTIFFWK